MIVVRMYVMDIVLAQFPNLKEYTKYKEKYLLTFDDGTTTDLVHADFFEKMVGSRSISIGIFSHKNKKLFCAWGYKDEEHCSMHAVMGNNGKWFSPQVGCPIKIAIKDGERNIGLRMPTLYGDRRFYFKD